MEMLEEFFSQHGYGGCDGYGRREDFWQSCELRNSLSPIFDEPVLAMLSREGILSGCPSSLRDYNGSQIKPNTKLSSIFGSLTTGGAVDSEGVVYMTSASSLFVDNFNVCLDVHGSKWNLAGIDAESNDCLFYSVREYCHKRHAIPDELLFVHAGIIGSNIFAFGRRGVWALDFSGDECCAVRSFVIKKRCKVRLLGRSDNFSVFCYGKKSFFCNGESVIPLDDVPSMCYTFPTCAAILMPYGWLFASNSAYAANIAEACLGGDYLGVSEQARRMQAFLDPAFAIGLGLHAECITMASRICSENSGALDVECVQKLLKDEPSYRLTRLSR